MRHIPIIALSTCLLSSIASANSPIQPTTNSLSQAVLEINAMHAPAQTNMTPAKPYTNESEKNNSLSRAALAMQEAHMKTHKPNDQVVQSATTSTTTQQSSFYGAVLDKQFNRYK
ncbi:hypothetical protein LCGC14_0560570 [marine sediment metagenome]|uniref:Uncharacterized protein n=1 Tax=marine sediment metagenome TaxID=412755 RepID=A0A0F9UVE8_9ZZZZ|nr:hypothetical protein [Methylophaga sp.]HEC59342.1 hypothetical protein [Methylophaga sp.]